MIRIRTISDIEEIRKNKILPSDYICEIEDYFKILVSNLTGKKCFDKYSFEHDGDIIVLTTDDDIYDLPLPGLSKEYGGLYSAIIESCNKKKIRNRWIYQFLMLCNNDYVLVFYSEAGQFGKQFDQWIEEYI